MKPNLHTIAAFRALSMEFEGSFDADEIRAVRSCLEIGNKVGASELLRNIIVAAFKAGSEDARFQNNYAVKRGACRAMLAIINMPETVSA